MASNATAVNAEVPDKSGYNLFNPTPDDEMRKFTPDRPAKGYSVRTIDAGHVEVETDIFSDTYSKYLGITTRSIQALDPNVKIGITNWADFEIQFNGLQSSQSLDSASGAIVAQGTGFGDVILRTKINLFGNDNGPVGLAVIPYVKVPSSVPVISNGAVEGGLIVPLALRLPQDYLVTLMTEVDLEGRPKPPIDQLRQPHRRRPSDSRRRRRQCHRRAVFLGRGRSGVTTDLHVRSGHEFPARQTYHP